MPILEELAHKSYADFIKSEGRKIVIEDKPALACSYIKEFTGLEGEGWVVADFINLYCWFLYQKSLHKEIFSVPDAREFESLKRRQKLLSLIKDAELAHLYFDEIKQQLEVHDIRLSCRGRPYFTISIENEAAEFCLQVANLTQGDAKQMLAEALGIYEAVLNQQLKGRRIVSLGESDPHVNGMLKLDNILIADKVSVKKFFGKYRLHRPF